MRLMFAFCNRLKSLYLAICNVEAINLFPREDSGNP